MTGDEIAALRERIVLALNDTLPGGLRFSILEAASDAVLAALAPHVAAQVAEMERLIEHASDVAARTVVARLGPELEQARAQVAEKDAEIARLRAEVERLERRIYPGQGEGYENEVERQRYVIENFQRIVRKRGEECDAALAREVTARRDALTEAADALWPDPRKPLAADNPPTHRIISDWLRARATEATP